MKRKSPLVINVRKFLFDVPFRVYRNLQKRFLALLGFKYAKWLVELEETTKQFDVQYGEINAKDWIFRYKDGLSPKDAILDDLSNI